jgi:WD40 repeat protein
VVRIPRELADHSPYPLGQERSVAYSPDGKFLAVGGCDGVVRIADPATGRGVRAIGRGEQELVEIVAFSQDSRRIAIVGEGEVSIHDVASGRELRRIGGVGFLSFALAPDGRFAALGSGPVQLWDLEAGRLVRSFPSAERSVGSLAISPDGRLLAVGQNDGAVPILELATGREVRRLPGHKQGVVNVKFFPDGSKLLTVTHDVEVRAGAVATVWDLATGAEVLNKGVGGFGGAVSPDGRFVAVGSGFGVMVLDVATGRDFNVRDQIWRPGPLVFSPRHDLIFAAWGSTRLGAWKLATGREVHRFKDHQASIGGLALTPDERAVISGDDGLGSLVLRDVETGRTIRSRPPVPDGLCVSGLTFSPDGKLLAEAMDDVGVVLRDADTWAEIRRVAPPRGEGLSKARFHAIAFLDGGRTLITAEEDGEITLWDVATGRKLHALNARFGDLQAFAVSPDGHSFAAAGLQEPEEMMEVHEAIAKGPVDFQRIRLWDRHDGVPKLRTTLLDEPARWDQPVSLAFSPDGRLLAWGSLDSPIHVMDTTLPRELTRLSGHIGNVDYLTTDPVRGLLFSSSHDGTVLVWDWRAIARMGDAARAR